MRRATERKETFLQRKATLDTEKSPKMTYEWQRPQEGVELRVHQEQRRKQCDVFMEPVSKKGWMDGGETPRVLFLPLTLTRWLIL